MRIQAEASLYPLKTLALGRPIRDFLGGLEDAGLTVRRGTMSSTLEGDVDDVFAALSQAFKSAAGHCGAVLVLKVSNACPVGNESGTGSTNDREPM